MGLGLAAALGWPQGHGATHPEEIKRAPVLLHGSEYGDKYIARHMYTIRHSSSDVGLCLQDWPMGCSLYSSLVHLYPSGSSVMKKGHAYKHRSVRFTHGGV
jgi:hypothetical protein